MAIEMGKKIDNFATRALTPLAARMLRGPATARLAESASVLAGLGALSIGFRSWEMGTALRRAAELNRCANPLMGLNPAAEPSAAIKTDQAITWWMFGFHLYAITKHVALERLFPTAESHAISSASGALLTVGKIWLEAGLYAAAMSTLLLINHESGHYSAGLDGKNLRTELIEKYIGRYTVKEELSTKIKEEDGTEKPAKVTVQATLLEGTSRQTTILQIVKGQEEDEKRMYAIRWKTKKDIENNEDFKRQPDDVKGSILKMADLSQFKHPLMKKTLWNAKWYASRLLIPLGKFEGIVRPRALDYELDGAPPLNVRAAGPKRDLMFGLPALAVSIISLGYLSQHVGETSALVVWAQRVLYTLFPASVASLYGAFSYDNNALILNFREQRQQKAVVEGQKGTKAAGFNFEEVVKSVKEAKYGNE